MPTNLAKPTKQKKPAKRTQLTKRTIDAAHPKKSEYFIWDSSVQGLGLRVTPRGAKSFVLFYRTLDNTQRKPTIGGFGQITLEQARQIARDMLAAVRGGSDPSRSRKDARQAPTMADVCDRFISEHAALKKELTRKQYEQLIEAYVKPAVGTRKVASVAHEDVAKLIYGVGAEYPIAANRTRALLSKLFNLTEKWGLRPTGTNPVVHVERYRENKVHRDLTEDELARLAKVLMEAEAEPEPGKEDVSEDPRAVAALRLLLFTGCRRNEVLHLKWAEVELERGILRLGDSKTGQKVVHLNTAARDVLAAQKKVRGNPYVFPSALVPGKPLHDIKRPWDRIRERAQLEGVRLHDLRHHFATTAAGAGFSLPLIGRLLGHRNVATTQRYAALADSPARLANEQVGRVIAGALKPAKLAEDIAK